MLPFEVIRERQRKVLENALSTGASASTMARPHSRPSTQPQTAGGAGPAGRLSSSAKAPSHPAIAGPAGASLKSRAVMLPGASGKARPVTSGAAVSPVKSASPIRVRTPARPLSRGAPSALSPRAHPRVGGDEVHTGGQPVPSLLPEYSVGINVKVLSLDVDLPRNTHETCTAPRCRLTPRAPRVLDLHPPAPDQPSSVVVVSKVVEVLVGVEEAGMDRALAYTVEACPVDYYDETPTVGMDGTLRLTVARGHIGGPGSLFIRLADNAAVTAEGRIVASDPVEIKVVYHDPRAGTRPQFASADWKSFKHKAQCSSVTVEAPPPQTPAKPTTASGGARALNAALGTSAHSAVTDTDPTAIVPAMAAAAGGASAPDYMFPTTNIHSLRDTALSRCAGPLPVAPVFASPLAPIERLRLVQLMQERDRLAGEATEADKREAVEAKLKAKLSSSEERHGATSPELCPILVRLAQIAVVQGSQRSGDAVEFFDRVVRIRSTAIGLAAFDAAASYPAPGQYDEQAVAAAVQAMTVLGMYLKHLGRYADSQLYLESAVALAAKALGSDHVTHLRAVAQVAELCYLRGDYRRAAALFRGSLTDCEVLFDDDPSATSAVRHLLGVTLLATDDVIDAVECHEVALAAREEAYRNEGDPDRALQLSFLIAESLTYLAAALAVSGADERSARTVNRSMEIFQRGEVGRNAQFAVALCTLQAIGGEVQAAMDNYDAAANLLQKAAATASRTRGSDSIEAAVFAADLGILLLSDEPSRAEALQLLTNARGIFVAAFGSGHPYAARIAAVIAQAHLAGNNLAAAAEQAAGSVQALRRALGPDHPDTAAAAEVNAAVLLALRTRDEAALTEAMVAFTIVVRRPPGPQLTRLLTLVAAICGRLRREFPEDVAVATENLVQRVKAAVGESSPDALEPLQNIAEACFWEGDYDRAHHFLVRALKIADSTNLIFLLGALFKPAAQLSASDVTERNRLAANRLSAKSALHFAAVLFAIGCVFEAQGRLHDAQSTQLQVLAALELAGEQHSIRTAETLRTLAMLLDKDGHYGDALAYAEKARNLLLEHHPKAVEFVQLTTEAVDVIDRQVRSNGYSLVRHVDSRYRFSVFL